MGSGLVERLYPGWIAVEIHQLIYKHETVFKYENQAVFEIDNSHAVVVWCLSKVF